MIYDNFCNNLRLSDNINVVLTGIDRLITSQSQANKYDLNNDVSGSNELNYGRYYKIATTENTKHFGFVILLYHHLKHFHGKQDKF